MTTETAVTNLLAKETAELEQLVAAKSEELKQLKAKLKTNKDFLKNRSGSEACDTAAITPADRDTFRGDS